MPIVRHYPLPVARSRRRRKAGRPSSPSRSQNHLNRPLPPSLLLRSNRPSLPYQQGLGHRRQAAPAQASAASAVARRARRWAPASVSRATSALGSARSGLSISAVRRRRSSRRTRSVGVRVTRLSLTRLTAYDVASSVHQKSEPSPVSPALPIGQPLLSALLSLLLEANSLLTPGPDLRPHCDLHLPARPHAVARPAPGAGLDCQRGPLPVLQVRPQYRESLRRDADGSSLRVRWGKCKKPESECLHAHHCPLCVLVRDRHLMRRLTQSYSCAVRPAATIARLKARTTEAAGCASLRLTVSLQPLLTRSPCDALPFPARSTSRPAKTARPSWTSTTPTCSAALASGCAPKPSAFASSHPLLPSLLSFPSRPA